MKSRSMWGLLLVTLITASFVPSSAAKPELKCRADGTFRVVMFSDTQDGPNMLPSTTALMGKVLDEEKPDFVVIGGDCIAGAESKTVEEVKEAISHVAYPMEQRSIPWAIVFGNHDQEHYPKTKLGKDKVIDIYRSYRCNLNVRGSKKIHGAGNDCLIVKGSSGSQPVFCFWLIDSGEYAPKQIGGYEWIHTDQVAWYYETSMGLESRYGRKIPGIMYFHIPLPEVVNMANNTKIDGDRFDAERPSQVNSGMLAAVLDRGDVKGIFWGHDHENNYVGEWKGIRMGYDSTVGHRAYNLPDSDPRSLHTHGGRVFQINESAPESFRTWMRFSDGTTH